MITSGRRAKRPDGAEYRRLRRRAVAGRTLLEMGDSSPSPRAGMLQAMARSLSFLAHLVKRR